MTELALILLGGTLGSAHCIGMCAGFVVLLSAGCRSPWENLRRQIVYALGRVGTYAFGGTLAGYGGWRLTQWLGSIIHAQAWLAIAAGLLLCWQGLLASGLLRAQWRGTSSMPCLSGEMLKACLARPSRLGVFLAGMANGFLPCGLVYAYLALAATRGTPFRGMQAMLAFGLGTIPAMLATGLFGSWLGHVARRRFFLACAGCVVLTGTLSIARGVGSLGTMTGGDPPPCPLCASKSELDLATRAPDDAVTRERKSAHR